MSLESGLSFHQEWDSNVQFHQTEKENVCLFFPSWLTLRPSNEASISMPRFSNQNPFWICLRGVKRIHWFRYVPSGLFHHHLWKNTWDGVHGWTETRPAGKWNAVIRTVPLQSRSAAKALIWQVLVHWWFTALQDFQGVGSLVSWGHISCVWRMMRSGGKVWDEADSFLLLAGSLWSRLKCRGAGETLQDLLVPVVNRTQQALPVALAREMQDRC